MISKRYKVIGFKFVDIDINVEMKIRQYINTSLMTSKSIAKTMENGDNKQQRNDYRLEPNENIALKFKTHDTVKVPSQNVSAKMKDISCGGICVLVPKNVQLVRNGSAEIYLDFIQPGLVVKGIILGLR